MLAANEVDPTDVNTRLEREATVFLERGSKSHEHTRSGHLVFFVMVNFKSMGS